MRLHFITVQSFLVFGLFICSAGSYAQQKQPVTEQVEVIRQYKPILGDAVKMKKSPSFSDENQQGPQVKYSYRDLKLTKDTAHTNIKADSLRNADSLLSPFLYAKLGGGNLRTSLAEVYLNSKPNKNNSYGLAFRHLAQTGKIANQQFLSEQLDIFGKTIFPSNFLSGRLSASGRQVYFYGYDHSAVRYSKSDIRQTLQNADAEVEFGSNADTAAGLSYGLKGHGYNFFDSYKNRENHYDFNGLIGYKISQFSFNLAAAVNYNKLTQQYGTVNNNSVFRFNPYIFLDNKIIRVKAGLNVVNEFGDVSKTLVFPDVNVDVLLSYGFNVFGGIKGDVIQNTLRTWTSQNPWLRATNVSLALPASPNQPPPTNAQYSLLNTKQKFDYFAGIKGAFTPAFNYRLQIEAGLYDNMSFFINQTYDSRYFSVVYDGNGTTKEEFYAEVNYLAGDKFRLNVNLDYLDFKLKTLNQPWHTPKIKSGLELHFNPSSHWQLNASLYYTGEQKASTLNLSTPTNPVLNTVTLASFTDLNLGAEYRITKKFSLFVNGNNLLNKQYQNYLNYPVLGLNVFGGLTLTF